MKLFGCAGALMLVLSAAVAAVPLSALAQQKVYRIGYLADNMDIRALRTVAGDIATASLRLGDVQTAARSTVFPSSNSGA